MSCLHVHSAAVTVDGSPTYDLNVIAAALCAGVLALASTYGGAAFVCLVAGKLLSQKCLIPTLNDSPYPTHKILLRKDELKLPP